MPRKKTHKKSRREELGSLNNGLYSVNIEVEEASRELGRHFRRITTPPAVQKTFAVALMLFVLFVTAFIFKEGEITGWLISGEQLTSYTQDIDMNITGTGEEVLVLETVPQSFNLRSLKLSGHVIGEGTFEVYLVDASGDRYLMLDDQETEVSELSSITMHAVKNPGKGKDNKKDKGNENAAQSITTSLEYATGSIWDEDDDGTAYIEDGVVDLTVAGSESSWDADESMLCTIWTVRSLDEYVDTTLCHGAADCCALSSVAPEEETWYAGLYLFHRKYGATENNTVTAQVVFLNQSIGEETYFESVIGSTASLPVVFIEKPIFAFTDACTDTCSLPAGLNGTEYTIEFHMSRGVTIHIENMTYTLENTSIGLDVPTEDNQTVDITPEVKDSKGNVLGADIEFRDAQDNLVLRQDITRRDRPIIGGDLLGRDDNKVNIGKGRYKIKLNFTDNKHPVKSMEIEDLDLEHNTTEFINVDDVPETGENAKYLEVYAIDPTAVNFTNATVRAIAKGTELYKCKEWNFTEQSCYGDWVFLKSITPGQEYTFTLTPDDPGYGENGTVSNLTSAVHLGIDQLANVIAKDDTFYVTDMKDANKKLYLNFSQNLTNGTVLKIFAKRINQVTTGIYAQTDTGGTTPFGTYTVTSSAGEWHNVTLNISTPTYAIWLGEGTGSGTDPKDEYDVIFAEIPATNDSTPPASITGLSESATGIDWIRWDWTNPADADFDSAILYLNGTNVANVSGTGYNFTGLQTFTSYRLTVHTKDLDGNVNSTDVWDNAATQDGVPPQYTNIIDQNNTEYAPGGNYQFNITWQDNVGINTVTFEFDGTNHSGPSNDGDVYYISMNNPAAGTYQYRWFAEDFLNNVNSTATRQFVVIQASTTTTLYLNSSQNNLTATYGTTTNATATTTAGSLTLYRDGTPVSNPELTTLAVGQYNYTALNPGNENYTGSSETWSVTVDKAATSMTLTASPSWSETYGTATTINCSADNPEVTAQLHRNGTLVGIPDVQTLAANEYQYTCNASETQNYTGNTTSNTLTINKAVTTTSLFIDGSQANTTVTYGATTNATATTTAGTLTLYREGSPVSNPEIDVLGAGSYNYTAVNAGNENYTGSSEAWSVTVDKAATSMTLTASPSWTETYGTATTVNCTADNPEVTPKLYRNGTLVGMPDVQTLAANQYQYTCNASETQNYTSDSTSNTLTINKAASEVNLLLNGTDNNLTVERLSDANITTETTTGDDVTIYLYRNGTLINSGLPPLENITQYPAYADYNITAVYTSSENYSASTKTHWLLVRDTTAPAGVSGLAETGTGNSWITWNWTNPGDADFAEAILYLNGTNIANVSGTGYNFTGLDNYRNYGLTVHTKDVYGNVNTNDVSDEAMTTDTQAPGSVTGLSESATGKTWIRWNWTNPGDTDFDSAILYLNGTNLVNVSGTGYNFTGLETYTSYRLTVHTKDTQDNVNNTDVFDNAATQDGIAPQYTNIIDQNNTAYSPGGNYQFNITWTDNVGINTVTFEFDGTNHSGPSNDGNVYYISMNDLAAGTHQYRWFAEDFLNNENSTGTYTFVVSKAAATLSLTASPSWTETYGTMTTINCTADNNEVTAQLYRNGTLAGIPDIQTSASNQYQYTCNASETQNYTSDTTSNTLTINKAASTVDLLLNGTDNNLTVERLADANITASITAGDSVSIYTYRNGTLINSGTSPLVNISQYAEQADYNITVTYTASENYTASSKTHWLLIRDTTPPATISGLGETGAGTDWIQWNWTNPTDADFDSAILYLNGTNIANTSGTGYNITGLQSYKNYELTVHTNDIYSNVNAADATDQAMTLDNTPPTYSNITDQNNTAYAPGKDYQFNITWTDNIGINTVTFESDGTNYSGPSNNGDVYYMTLNNLAAGTHSYSWYAQDTAGNWNSTGDITFGISRATTTMNMTASPSWTETYGTETSIGCSADNSEVTPQLYRNGTLAGVPDVQTPASNQYQYTCNASETQNYTGDTTSNTLTVNKAASEVNLLLNGTDGNITIEVHSHVNETGTVLTGEGTIELYEAGVLVNSGTSPLTSITQYDALGTYNVTTSYPETQNHSSSGETHHITVSDTTGPRVYLGYPADGTYSPSNTQNFTFNFTDNYHSTASCTIYLNNTASGTNASVPAGTSTAITNSSVPEGENIWSVNCTDGSGNAGGSGTRTIIVDTTPPTIQFIDPTEGATIGYNTLFDIHAEDNLAGTQWMWHEIKNATGSVVHSGQDSTDDYHFGWNTTTVADGNYTITAYANDTLGNTENRSITLRVSNTLPFIQISSPIYDSTEYNSNFNLNITYYDDELSAAGYSITNSTGGIVQSAENTSLNSTTHSFADLVDVAGLQDGSYTIFAYANDTTGYVTTKQRSFIIDKTAPAYSAVNGPPDPSTYSPAGSYNFNITWTETNSIDEAIFEFDGVNYSDATRTGDVFSKIMSPLGAGTHDYRWSANDTTGNQNSTGTMTSTINRASSSCLLQFDNISPQPHGTQVTANCSCTNPETDAILWRNDTDVTSTENNQPATLAAGTYDYECNSSQTQNYTDTTDSATFTIDRRPRQ
ncbi:MAG: Ig-like domain-containing protein [Candidatus Woesearchaeota archaeon]